METSIHRFSSELRPSKLPEIRFQALHFHCLLHRPTSSQKCPWAKGNSALPAYTRLLVAPNNFQYASWAILRIAATLDTPDACRPPLNPEISN